MRSTLASLRWLSRAPGRATQSCPGFRLGTSATKPTLPPWPSSSTLNFVNRLQRIGETGPPRPQTDSASRLEARPKVPTASIAFLYGGIPPSPSIISSSPSSLLLLSSGRAVIHYKPHPTLSTRYKCHIAAVQKQLSRHVLLVALWRWRPTIDRSIESPFPFHGRRSAWNITQSPAPCLNNHSPSRGARLRGLASNA